MGADDRLVTIARLRQLMAEPPKSQDYFGLRDSAGHKVTAEAKDGVDDATGAGQTAAGPDRPITDLATARDIALRRLEVRARTCQELRGDLISRQVDPGIADQVIDRLRSAGLLDDRAFAEEWVEVRGRTKKLAAARLRQELRAKGVADEVITDALDQAQARDQESERALAFARQKVTAMSQLPPEVIKRRLLAQLERRGFAWAESSRAVGAVLAEIRGE